MSQLHYSNSLFLVAKRSGGRPVINLRPLNRFVPNQKFRMESILLPKDILKPNSFLAKIDLKDAFYSIPIAKMSRKYLQFIYHNKLYQFCVLPFGISAAPRVFSKILKPVIALLRTRGNISHYLFRRSTHCCRNVHRLSEPYKTSNFSSGVPAFSNQLRKIHIIPTQKLEFLGFIIDSTSMSLALPVGKIQSIKSSARKLLRTKGAISIRLFSRFMSLCTSAKYAVPQAPLHYRSLQFLKNSVSKGRRYSPILYNLEVHLSPEAITDLKWWADHLQYHSKTPIIINDPDLIITSDASDLGWGAWCGGKSVQGLWSQGEMFWHFNPRELQAAYLALKIFSPSQINQLFHIQLQTDNQAAVSYINHLGEHTQNFFAN